MRTSFFNTKKYPLFLFWKWSEGYREMGRFGNPRKRIWDVQREFSEDFTVVNESLLLCKFCNSIGRSESTTCFE